MFYADTDMISATSCILHSMLTDPESVDVAIVGAGIIGVATAAYLAAGGARVTVFERDQVASGASGRNLGTILDPMNSALSPLHAPSLAGYRELAGALPDLFALPAAPVGLLMLDPDEAKMRTLVEQVSSDYPELEPRVVDASAIEPAVASGLSGCLLNTAYPAEPASATAAFAELARRSGATVRVGAPASVIFRDGRAIGVDVGGEEVRAGTVLVAAGPWSPGLVRPDGSWRPITPLWGVTAQIELDGDAPRHALSEAFPEDEEAARGMFTLTTARSATGRYATALGSTFNVSEPDPKDHIAAMIDHGARFVPGLASARVLATRTCARPVSRDGLPLLGPVPGVEGLHIASGHGAWGISLGPATARMAADALLGSSDVPDLYAAARFR
ncbi:NAD(P)/FAD-dependent oxidoreductase [Rhodococcus sp. NBC_00297]|uniref:NAD(P)/FAD-dependent oxidoreductase n=1 Tax=Rhodococcus sp. NBC_00297 TaxID=2976005 RepID=UPI002E2C608B|nr:FAD-binding oxidoreductase [Rhodococcus sp. NBC_00297]